MDMTRVLMCGTAILVLALGVAASAARGGNVDGLHKQLDEAEKAVADARNAYTPTSKQVQQAGADLRKAQEQVKAVLLKELLPALRKLEAERMQMAADMLPTRPKMPRSYISQLAVRLHMLHMKELSARIAADQLRVDKLAARVSDVLTKEDFKSLGLLVLDLGNGVSMVLVRIPAGEFTMGCENGRDNEKPVRKVTISKAFYMNKYEVTQEQWEALMGSNPSSLKGKMNPVHQVSWDDCQAFLKKLNAKLAGVSCRLPTEAEWEYACRAGSATKFCFGDEEKTLGNYGWYSTNSEAKAHPVGEKKPNAWGLYDMHGNVSEWCQDWYADKYPDGGQTDPTGPATGQYRVVRGGTWFRWHSAELRSTARGGNTSDLRSGDLGFRVACAGGVE